MRILFLTYCYPPQKFPRSIQISHLVQELKKNENIEIQVITSPAEEIGDQSLLSFTPLDNVQYAEKSLITKFIEKSKGYRIKKAIFPDFKYWWHFNLFKKASYLIATNKTDVIVTFGHPMSTHIAGLKLKKKFPHLRWITHFSDPWVDNPFDGSNKWVKFTHKYYQDKIFSHADNLIFTSQETIELVTRSSPKLIKEKAFVLTHSFNDDLYPKAQKKNASFTIRHLGNFYGNRQPDSLFKAIKNFSEEDLENVIFELIGHSTEDLASKIQFYGLQKYVSVLPGVSYLDSLKLMKESDLLLIIDAPGEISPFLPSKLIDYIGANKPIFGITPTGTARKLIEEMGFMTANPDNPQEIHTKLMEIIGLIKKSNINKISNKIRKLYIIKNVASVMLKFFSRV